MQQKLLKKKKRKHENCDSQIICFEISALFIAIQPHIRDRKLLLIRTDKALCSAVPGHNET